MKKNTIIMLTSVIAGLCLIGTAVFVYFRYFHDRLMSGDKQ